jgi:hypothetical protein
MRYEARIAVYDCMDQIVVSAVVWEGRPGWEGGTETVLSTSTSLQGEGITDPTVWLRDSLVGLLEAI